MEESYLSDLFYLKVMGELRFGDFQRKNMTLTVLFQQLKHGGGGVMIWGCLTWESLGPLVRAEGTINSQKYIDILNTHLIPFMERDLKGKLLSMNFSKITLLFIQAN